MRLPVLFFTAIVTPILLCAALLLPAYASVYGATYIVYGYDAKGVNPMLDKFLDIFTVIDGYQNLLNYWMTNQSALDTVNYTLPIVVLPIFGALFSVWLTYKIARRLLNFFQLSASI